MLVLARIHDVFQRTLVRHVCGNVPCIATKSLFHNTYLLGTIPQALPYRQSEVDQDAVNPILLRAKRGAR